MMQTEAVIRHIVAWLSDYARQAGAKGFVVGVSGGVDSALVSSLCAATDLDVLLLALPIRQKADQMERALTHIGRLQARFANVRSHVLDLGPTFEAFEQSAAAEGARDYELAMANTRSRLRMAALYFYAQTNGLLVAGTGNKIEDFGVGFFTKYGDGGVDVSPIGGLLKTQVYRLAEALAVDESILQAVPTDGLWDEERTDEQQMGASYPELEWAMQQAEQGADGSGFSGREREVWEIYRRLNRAAQHKILPIPVCPIPSAYLSAED